MILPVIAVAASKNRRNNRKNSTQNFHPMKVPETALSASKTADYRALCSQPPQVVSITFFRDPRELPRKRLGFRLSQALDEMAEGGGDIRIAELDHHPDSLISGSCEGVVEVGDILVGFNGIACYGNHFFKIQESIGKASGLVTLHFRKTTAAPAMDQIRQAIFLQPHNHTCIPMAIDLERKWMTGDHQETKPVLCISRIDTANPWLKASCLQEKNHSYVVVLSINDIPSFELEEEDAQVFLQTKNDFSKIVSIKTYSKTEQLTTASLQRQHHQRWRLGDRVLGRNRQQQQQQQQAPKTTAAGMPLSPDSEPFDTVSFLPAMQQIEFDELGRQNLSNGRRSYSVEQYEASKGIVQENNQSDPKADDWRRTSLEDTI